MVMKICVCCGTEFLAKRKTKKFCGPRCRYLNFIGRSRKEGLQGVSNATEEQITAYAKTADRDTGKLKEYVRELLQELLAEHPLTLSFGGFTVSYQPGNRKTTNGTCQTPDTTEANGLNPLASNTSTGTKKELLPLILQDEDEEIDPYDQLEEPDEEVEEAEDELEETEEDCDQDEEDEPAAELEEQPVVRLSSNSNAREPLRFSIPESSRLPEKRLENTHPADTETGETRSSQGPAAPAGTKQTLTVKENYREQTPIEDDSAWVVSRFLTLIEDTYNETSYFSTTSCSGIESYYTKAFSTKFLTLLKCTYKLSIQRNAPMNAVKELSKAYEKLLASLDFRSLPFRYPYRTSFLGLAGKLTSIVDARKHEREVTIYFTPKKKAEILCLIIALNKKLPSVKFKDTHFGY